MRHRAFIFLPVVAIYLIGFVFFAGWQKFPVRGDDAGYYMHLVSFWINQDVGDYTQTTADLVETYPGSRTLVEDPFLIKTTETGRKSIKYTLGVALMETPFFFLAHFYTSNSDTYRANGWDPPYLFMVSLGNLFFVLLGLWILPGLLKPNFSWPVTCMTWMGIALATNLYFHATYVTMAHGFLFFDYCLLLWLTIQFYRKPGPLTALGIGLVTGLIAITRVPEIICLIIPLFWGVTSRSTFLGRLHFFRRNARLVFWAAFGWLAIFSLQLTYWYYVSGQLIFNPYEGEGFNFLKPEIWLGWFDFANGWLIYTPIMIFGLVGLFFLRRYFADILLPLLVFLALHVWIHYSYYAWTYYPGLGQRPMVETYPLLAFGLAASFQFIWSKGRIWRWIPPFAVVSFAALNLFQTWQTGQGLLITDRGSAGYYWESFGALSSSRNALLAFDTGNLQPDSSRLSLFNTLAFKGFEDTTLVKIQAGLPREGMRATKLRPDQDTLWLTSSLPLGELPVKAWLKVGINVLIPSENKIWIRDNCADLVLELRDPSGRRTRKESIKMSTYVGNTGFSLWDTGAPGQWGEAYYFIRPGRKVGPEWTVRAYILNPGGQVLMLDDFKLEVFDAKR